MTYPLCRIMLDRVRAIEKRDPQVEGTRALIRFRAQLEALAHLALHPEARIDSLHDELVAAFEDKFRELETCWTNPRITALINQVIVRIKSEKARVATLAQSPT